MAGETTIITSGDVTLGKGGEIIVDPGGGGISTPGLTGGPTKGGGGTIVNPGGGIIIIPNPGPIGGSKLWQIGRILSNVIGFQVNQVHFFCSGTEGSHKFYICDNISGVSTKDIFNIPNKGYKIKIRMTFVEFFQNSIPTTDGFVTLEIGCGNLPVERRRYKVSEFDNIISEEFFYQVTDFGRLSPNGTNFWIRKIGAGIVKIVGSEVIYGEYAYDEQYNNKLLNYVDDLFFSFNSRGKKIQLKSGENARLKFGNGQFKSGIWKSGVWNNGYRSKWPTDVYDDIFYFDNVSLNTFQVSPNQWFLKLDSNTNIDNITNILINLNPNDFISIGNVVGIDINEERYLLKDYYRITEISILDNVVTLTIDIPVAKFPLRRFEIDSEIHLIYVTKNIWAGGTFLNGYFRGVWNFGLFKGFPFTTVMDQSHFISGKIDGGRFISQISSITSSVGIPKEYHTGLIQYMDFYDNNISERESTGSRIDNTYQTWIDVNYYTQSFVNLNSLTNIFDQNFGKVIPLPNLYGYPTRDVLSSRSRFKNTTDSEVDTYNLGTKFKVFTDHLGENGFFTRPFNSEGRPGLDNFINRGWSANSGNFYNTPTVSFVYNSNITRRNFNRFSIVMATFGYNILNNSNIQVEDKRYTLIEYDLEYYTRGFDPVSLQPTNTFQRPITLLGSNYNIINNVYRSGITKTEYFYNKNALDLILRFNSQLQIPVGEGLSIYGYNVDHEFLPPTGESSLTYSTTWSMIAPATDSLYRGDFNIPDTRGNAPGGPAGGPGNDFGKTPSPIIGLGWESTETYNKGDIVRDIISGEGSDSLGNFWMSLNNSNIGNPPSPISPNWGRLMTGFNNFNKEVGGSILANSDIFSFFTSLRVSYFKFLEIDALPFFKYYDFEVNFVDTFKDGTNLALEFTKPHGFKVGDKATLKLDEIRFNPQYDNATVSVTSVVDGTLNIDEAVYTITTNIPYGTTPSFINESGTLFKQGGADRIDRRIQNNYSAISPKVSGFDEDFIYLGNNQIYVDRSDF